MRLKEQFWSSPAFAVGIKLDDVGRIVGIIVDESSPAQHAEKLIGKEYNSYISPYIFIRGC